MKTQLPSKKELLASIGYYSDDLMYLKKLNKVIWKIIELHDEYDE